MKIIILVSLLIDYVRLKVKLKKFSYKIILVLKFGYVWNVWIMMKNFLSFFFSRKLSGLNKK